MSDSIVREIDLKVVYTDLASGPAKAFHDAELRRIRQARDEQDKSDRAYVRAISGHLAAEKQLAAEKAKGIRAAAAEQAKADAAYVRATTRQLAAERQLEREKERAAQGHQREIEKEERAYVRATMKKLAAERQLEEEQKRQKEASDAQTVGVLKMTAAFAGLNSVTGIMGTIADHFDRVRQDAFHAAEDVMRMRGAVRELQALRDQMGKTGAGVAHVMEGASRTLQTPEEYQQMETAGLGVGELAIRTPKDREQFEKAMVAAGKMQAQEGGDAGAYGQMMGQIALQSKGPLDAATMEGQLNRLYEIQRPGGFRTMSQAMGQYAKVGGLVQNGIYTPEQAMAGLSAFSVSSPDEAATKFEQYTRAVMAGRIKSRGMKVSDDVDLVKTDEYFKQLGIGEDDDAIGRGKKISADLARQQAAAGANGKKFNAYEYLMLRGFANQEDREAIMDLSGLRNSGRLEKIEAAEDAPIVKDAISRRFDEWKRADKFAKDRAAELSGQAATLKQGILEEPLVLAQKVAFARLKSQGKIGGTFEEWKGAGRFRALSQDVFFGGYHSQVDAEAMRALKEEGKRVGIATDTPLSAAWSPDEYAQGYARRVQAAGGDVTRGVDEDLKRTNSDIQKALAEQNDLLREQLKLMQDAQQRPGPMAQAPMARGNGVR